MTRPRNENGLTEYQQKVLDSLSFDKWTQEPGNGHDRITYNRLIAMGFVKRKRSKEFISGNLQFSNYMYLRIK